MIDPLEGLKPQTVEAIKELASILRVMERDGRSGRVGWEVRYRHGGLIETAMITAPVGIRTQDIAVKT